MNGEAVTAIADLAQVAAEVGTKLTKIDGRDYFLVGNGELRPIFPPRVDSLKVHTLGALADYAKLWGHEGAVIHVESHARVLLFGPPDGLYRRREYPCIAEWAELIGTPAAPFSWGQYMPLETFIVGLMALFVPTSEREAVLRLVGNIADQAELKVQDDGVTQEVSTRAGIVLRSTHTVPNPITLRPYRTFRDIEQPPSPFVLRVKRDEGKSPQVALFEADGGMWKLEAIRLIETFFTETLEGSTAPTILA